MQLTYEPFEKLNVKRPVHRVRWLTEQVATKRVLDLGALDETAIQSKVDMEWLHRSLASSAGYVLGIDNARSLKGEGLETGANSKIVQGDVYSLHKCLLTYDPEIVVAGEIIEHLSDTLGFLAYLKSRPELHSKRLILTTPNATALHNCMLTLIGRESNHEDHLQIYSYKTLNTLMTRAGFKNFKLIPYYSSFPELRHRSSSGKATLISLVEKSANLVSWLFPLLGGGWIVDATI